MRRGGRRGQYRGLRAKGARMRSRHGVPRGLFPRQRVRTGMGKLAPFTRSFVEK